MPQDLSETDLRLTEVTLHYAAPRRLDFDDILTVIDAALDAPGRAFHMSLTEDGTSAVYASGGLIVAITCQDHPLPAPTTPPRIMGRSDPHGLADRLASHTAFVRMALEDPVDPDAPRPAPGIALPLRVARALARYLVHQTQPELLHWGTSDLTLAPEDFLDLSTDAHQLHLFCATRPGPAEALVWLAGAEHILNQPVLLCDPDRDVAALEAAGLLFVEHCLSTNDVPQPGTRFEFDDGAPLTLMSLDTGPFAETPGIALSSDAGAAAVMAACALEPAPRRGGLSLGGALGRLPFGLGRGDGDRATA